MKKITLHHSLESLPDSLPDSCLRSFESVNHEADFFTSFAWLNNLWTHSLSEEHDLYLYEIAQEGKVQLLLPLCSRKSGSRWGMPRKLCAAANYYTSLVRLMTYPPLADSQQNMQQLVASILSETPRWDSLDLHPMDRDSAQFIEMKQACQHAGMAVQEYFCFGNWYLPVNGRTFAEYLDGLPSRLKNTLKKKRRQLEKSLALEICLFDGLAGLEQAIADYELVYRSSWKSAEASPLFIAGLMRTCAQLGHLRLGIAYLEGRPVAAQLWIVSQDVASIYKLAYDEAYANLSVGSILTAYLMEQVIDVDHVAEVDYMTGDDAYKQDWMSHRRERWGLLAFNLRTVYGLSGACWHIGRQQLNVFFSTIRRVLGNAFH